MKKGFTLLEILLVIAAIGILAAIVIVAINPNRQLAQVRDAERRNEVNALHKALEQYSIDTGEYPGGIDQSIQEVCAPGGSIDCIDLSLELVPTYLAAIPEDPQAQGDGSGYSVSLNSLNSRIAVSSINTEISEDISINPISPYVLEQFPGSIAAYSLRLLNPEYTGPALRVRRASDNSELDIGFVEDSLDTATLEVFASGTNAFVRTWYDQSGNGNDGVQSLIGNQPQIYDSVSGIITENGQPAISIDGLGQGVESPFTISADSGFSIFMVKRFDVSSSLRHSISFWRGGSGPYIRLLRSTDLFILEIFGVPSSDLDVRSNATRNQTLLHLNYDGSLLNTGASIFQNGVDATTTRSGIITSHNSSLNTRLTLGEDETGASGEVGAVQEVIIFDDNQSTYSVGIEDNMNTYYSIY